MKLSVFRLILAAVGSLFSMSGVILLIGAAIRLMFKNFNAPSLNSGPLIQVFILAGGLSFVIHLVVLPLLTDNPSSKRLLRWAALVSVVVLMILVAIGRAGFLLDQFGFDFGENYFTMLRDLTLGTLLIVLFFRESTYSVYFTSSS